MKSILFNLLLFLSLPIFAQRLVLQNHRFNGIPLVQGSSKLFLAGANHVWTNNENFSLPSRIGPLDAQTFYGGFPGIQPLASPIAFAWQSAGSTWLATRYLPGTTQLPQSSTGGLLKAANPTQGENFQLFNSLTLVSMQNITETTWTCGASAESENSVWLASELGLRRINLSNLNSNLLPAADIPISLPLTKSKNLKGQIFFCNSSQQWLHLQNNQASALNPENLGLPSQTRIADLDIFGTDTFLIANPPEPFSDAFKLFRRSAGTTQAIGSLDSLSQIAIEKNGRIWLSGQKSGLYYLENGNKIAIPAFNDKKLEDFLVDSTGSKWILTQTSEVYQLTDISPNIESDSIISLCDSTTWQFRDGSTSLNGPISTWQWDFGDGESSTEKDPRHRYKQEGLYTVRLTVSDGTAATASVSKEVFVTGNLYLGLKTPGPYVSCQALRLEAFGTKGFFWQKPDGSRDTSFSIMAQQSGLYKAQASNGTCVFRDSVQVTIQSNTLSLEIGLKDPDGNPLGEESSVFLPFQLQASASPADQICRIRWKLDGNLLPDSSSDVSFPVTEEGKHVLEFEGYNPFGCPVYGRKEWSLAAPSFPNLVTLNGDGKNEVFEIPSLRFLSENRLSIFNRWGKEVFNAAPYQNNWPAKEASPGTYFYQLQVAGKNYSGWIEVVIP